MQIKILGFETGSNICQQNVVSEISHDAGIAGVPMPRPGAEFSAGGDLFQEVNSQALSSQATMPGRIHKPSGAWVIAMVVQ